VNSRYSGCGTIRVWGRKRPARARPASSPRLAGDLVDDRPLDVILAQLIGPPRPFSGTNRVDEHRRARSIGETDVASDIQQTPRLFALGFDIVPIAVDPD